MPDVVDPAMRSRMMSGIRGKDTKPEMVIRRGLHARGLRFRIHCRDVPGNPDICFRSRKAVIFVHGCFWHGHRCHLFKWPQTRPEFWREKITGNEARDKRNISTLVAEGWRSLTVWECALKGSRSRPVEDVIADCVAWLDSDDPERELGGRA